MQSALAQAYEAKFSEDLGDLADRLQLEARGPCAPGRCSCCGISSSSPPSPCTNLAMRRAQNTKEYLVDPGHSAGAPLRARQPGEGDGQGGQGRADPGRLTQRGATVVPFCRSAR